MDCCCHVIFGVAEQINSFMMNSLALPEAIAPPGHDHSGPNQKAATERRQAGDGLAEKAERFAGMKSTHSDFKLPSETGSGIGLPFD